MKCHNKGNKWNNKYYTVIPYQKLQQVTLTNTAKNKIILAKSLFISNMNKHIWLKMENAKK